MKIVAIFIQILSIICCNICSFIQIIIVYSSTQAGIFHPALKIVNILTIVNSQRMLIVINTESLRKSHTVSISETVKNS